MSLLNSLADSATGGLGSALGSLPAAFIQNAFNKSAEKRNYEYSKMLNEQQFQYQQALQKQQNDFNVDMWNKANEYNSAAAQVKRYKDAGLNVGLMMGGQTAAVSPSISSASPSVPNSAESSFASSPNIIPMLNSVVNRDMQRRELDLQELKIKNDYEIEKRKTKAIEDKTASDIDLNAILGEKYNAEKLLTDSQVDETKSHVAQLNKSLDVMEEQINLFRAQQDESKALADKAKEERNWIRYNAITNRISANASKLTADATYKLYEHYGKKSDSEIKLNEQQCHNLAGQLANTYKDGLLKDIELQYKGDTYKANLELLNGQVNSVRIANDIRESTKYAEVVNAYISTVDNAANTVSDCAGAFVDVYTAGATTILKGKGAVHNQAAQTGMYDRIGWSE